MRRRLFYHTIPTGRSGGDKTRCFAAWGDGGENPHPLDDRAQRIRTNISKNSAPSVFSAAFGCVECDGVEIEKLRRKYDCDTAEGKVAFLREFAALMVSVPNAVERDVYVSKTAAELEVSKSAIETQLKYEQKRAAKRRRATLPAACLQRGRTRRAAARSSASALYPVCACRG